MKVNKIIPLIVALALASGGYAFAQGNSRHDGNDRGERQDQRDR